jgi:hypothetical protein
MLLYCVICNEYLNDAVVAHKLNYLELHEILVKPVIYLIQTWGDRRERRIEAEKVINLNPLA